MSDNTSRALSAVDAVRFLYLAQVAERHGHPKAAQRWRKKADRWLETLVQPNGLQRDQGVWPADTSPR